MLNTAVNSKSYLESLLQRKTILILIGIFLATLPISYIITAFVPIGIGIFDILRILFGSNFRLLMDIAAGSAIVLTSLFFTFTIWLFIMNVGNLKYLIPIVVFFVSFPVWLIINAFNPLSILIADTLRTRMGTGLVPSILLLSLTIVPSLLLAFLSWFLVKSKKNSKVQTRG